MGVNLNPAQFKHRTKLWREAKKYLSDTNDYFSVCICKNCRGKGMQKITYNNEFCDSCGGYGMLKEERNNKLDAIKEPFDWLDTIFKGDELKEIIAEIKELA